MALRSALSLEVQKYLESISGAPDFFERFLSSKDFARMKNIAKDFGGISIALPDTAMVLELNVYGMISFPSHAPTVLAVGAPQNGERDEAHSHAVHEFLKYFSRSVYPGRDAAWCTGALIQAIYDSFTAKIEDSMKRGLRT